jgi:hypothetical protein
MFILKQLCNINVIFVVKLVFRNDEMLSSPDSDTDCGAINYINYL